MTDYANAAIRSVDIHCDEYSEIAKRLWDYPEIRFQEWKSRDLLVEKMQSEGFSITLGVGGLPTAFTAVYGKGKPVIGFLGEYDALPNLSQQAGAVQKKPDLHSEAVHEAGHGCGHHLLGTALLGSAISLKEYLAQTGKEGTVIYYGCPAEEGGSGKVWMLREGVFDSADVLFSWHPDCVNRVSPNDVLASISKEYFFHGTSAHAASSPELGRSALEAAELMAVGMGFLREHIPGTARVHYAYLNAGGAATNVIQPEAGVVYQIRSPRVSEAQKIAERIDDLAKGAAIMTGTKVEIRFQRATAELRTNETLNDLLYSAFMEIGRAASDEDSLRLADALYETLPEEAKGNTAEKARIFYGADTGEKISSAIQNSSLVEVIYPRKTEGIVYGASTDVGDVSMCKPVGFLNVSCFVKDAPLHSWQAVSFGKSSFAIEGMLTAAKVIGAAAIRLVLEQELVDKAKYEWERQNAANPYVNPTPEDVQPQIR